MHTDAIAVVWLPSRFMAAIKVSSTKSDEEATSSMPKVRQKTSVTAHCAITITTANAWADGIGVASFWHIVQCPQNTKLIAARAREPPLDDGSSMNQDNSALKPFS